MGKAVSGKSELIRVTMIYYFTVAPPVDRFIGLSVPMQHCNTSCSGVTTASMRRTVREKPYLLGRDIAYRELIKHINSKTVVAVRKGIMICPF